MRATRTQVAVAICTYKRNEPLRALLRGLQACAALAQDRAAVGVVIVDDTAAGEAKVVAREFESVFELGLTYLISGRQNISMARNLAIETAMAVGDWTAMTDDDCEPTAEWLSALLDVQQRTGADAVTGPMQRRVPEDAPRWIIEQPFLALGMDSPPDGAEVTTAATFNSLVSSAWLKRHLDIRFEPGLGVVGGEDMVFFRSARAAGLRIHFSRDALVYENEPSSRATFAYQLRLYFWHGNSSYVSSVRSGVSPWRMGLHGAASLGRALLRPVKRVAHGKGPQLRYTLATVLHAAGKLVGPLGIRVDHR